MPGVTVQPEIVTAIDLAFPARGIRLKPGLEEIPADFKPPAVYQHLFHAVFFGTGKDFQFLPADDIDPEVAWRHLLVVAGCYGFKHEDKEYLWCWLASQWYPSFRYLYPVRDGSVPTTVTHNWPE